MAVRLLMGKRKKQRNGYRLTDCDSNGYHDDEYSEDEDEVFVEDMNGDGLAGMSKPLMAPRDRTKVKSRTPECRCRSLCRPVLYFLLMVTLLGSLVSVLLYALNKHNGNSSGDAHGGASDDRGGGAGPLGDTSDLIGCDTIEVEDVWVRGFPKLLTESAFRLVDVNQDGVLDIILGFATGADGFMVPRVVCDIYFNGTTPCFGGLLALEGLTGKELWRHYSGHELFGLNCNVDLDGDGVLDCLAGGRAASFEAVSGRQGSLLWTFQGGRATKRYSNVYTPQYVDDLDGDHVADLLVIHGGDPIAKPHSKTREAGRVLLMSGRTGKMIRWMVVPGSTETYYSPQVYFLQDGSPFVLFGTGGETHGGSLYVISMEHLKQGRIEMAQPIYTDRHKGVMTPPVLVDLTGDGVEDIVINPFNSTVVAIDGRTFAMLWNRTFPMSESYSTPGAGYFNDDDVPDFCVMASFGPGYPVYYHAEITVLDGKTGKPLIKPSVRVSVGAQASPLAVSMEGKGHDLFLYWMADCLGHEGEGGEYRFVNGTNVHEKSRSDFCKLRYNSRLFSKFVAVSSAIKAPGIPVYYSEERLEVEHNSWINTTVEALDFLRKHPEVEADLLREEMDSIREQQNRRKDQHSRLSNPNEESYLDTGVPLRGDTHSPGAKKGPLLGRGRGGAAAGREEEEEEEDGAADGGRGGGPYPEQYLIKPQQQQRLSAQPYEEPTGRFGQQQQQQRPRQRNRQPQYDRYDVSPFGSNPYDNVAVVDDDVDNGDGGRGRYGGYGRGGSGGTGAGYPYNLVPSSSSRRRPQPQHRRPSDFSGYFANENNNNNNPGNDYPLSGSGYNDGYPYKNYFQKRNLDDFDLLRGGRRDGGIFGDFGDGVPAGSGSDVIADGSDVKSKEPGHRGQSAGSVAGSERKDDVTGGDGNQKEEEVESGRVRRKKKTKQAGDQSERLKKNIHKLWMKRKRRHVGPHDDSGLQRLLSTGTLAPSTLAKDHPDYDHSVDLVFATYWFFPAKTKAILPKDQKCIDIKMAAEAQRFNPGNKYYGMDHDAYGHVVTDECLAQSHHQLNDHGTYESQKTFDPYNIHMGQMTVYRLRLKCTCSQVTNSTTNKRCAKVLPYDQQRWPAYMGRHGDSHWFKGA